LYFISQSSSIIHQRFLIIRKEDLKDIFQRFIRSEKDILKYFLIKLLMEWFNEFIDHLISNEFVKIIMDDLFSVNNSILSDLLLLINSGNEKIKFLILEFFNEILTSLSSNKEEMV
jgi:hypothetical protein